MEWRRTRFVFGGERFGEIVDRAQQEANDVIARVGGGDVQRRGATLVDAVHRHIGANEQPTRADRAALSGEPERSGAVRIACRSGTIGARLDQHANTARGRIVVGRRRSSSSSVRRGVRVGCGSTGRETCGGPVKSDTLNRTEQRDGRGTGGEENNDNVGEAIPRRHMKRRSAIVVVGSGGRVGRGVIRVRPIGKSQSGTRRRREWWVARKKTLLGCGLHAYWSRALTSAPKAINARHASRRFDCANKKTKKK
jgi:hypothetical protein